MIDEKLKSIMETFAGLDHGEQVDLFMAIKENLLKNRQVRLEEHQCRKAEQEDNIKTLYAGNDIILGNGSLAVKAGN